MTIKFILFIIISIWSFIMTGKDLPEIVTNRFWYRVSMTLCVDYLYIQIYNLIMFGKFVAE